jgi:cytochrome c oxidase subunit II
MQKNQIRPFVRKAAIRSKKPARLVMIALLGALLAVLLGPAIAEPAVENRVEVTARRFAFEPAEITVKKGLPVDLVLKSSDVSHGLRIRDLSIDVKINKGGMVEARFTPDKTGTFVGHCSVFCGSGHGHMTLTVHVVD